MVTCARWRSAIVNEKDSAPATQNKTDSLKSRLEQDLLSGLFLLDKMERPFLLAGLFVFLMPCHLLISLVWQIPGVSDRVAYGIQLRSSSPRTARFSGKPNLGNRFRGFNMTSGFVELEDMSNEDIPASEDWQSL